MEKTDKIKNVWLLRDVAFLFAVILLVVLSIASNLIANIKNEVSAVEYLPFFIFIVPGIFIWGLLKKYFWAYIAVGLWSLVSAVMLIMALLFSPLSGTSYSVFGQLVFVILIGLASFWLGIKNRRVKAISDLDP